MSLEKCVRNIFRFLSVLRHEDRIPLEILCTGLIGQVRRSSNENLVYGIWAPFIQKDVI